jgi:hypothetical protein
MCVVLRSFCHVMCGVSRCLFYHKMCVVSSVICVAPLSRDVCYVVLFVVS